MTSPPEHPHPVVIGAGVAGLVTALHLADAGLHPLVLEADPLRVGGRLQGGAADTLEHYGRTWAFPSEHGIHGFWSQYRNLRAILAAHGITPAFIPAQGQEWVFGDGDRVRRAELGRVLRRSLVPAPFHYLALFSNPQFWTMMQWWELLLVPWVGGALLATLAVEPMTEGADLDGLTLADLIEGWPPMLRAFVVTLARSGLSADPRTIPLAGFLAFMRFYTLLRRDAGAFDFLQGDAGSEIARPLADAAVRAGATLALGVRAAALHLDHDGGWHVRWERMTAGPEAAGAEVRGPHGDFPIRPANAGVLHAQHVVVAADAAGARRLLEASPALAANVAKLRWPVAQETVVIRLWFSRTPEHGEESGLLGGNFSIDNFFWLHRFQRAFREWHDATGGSAIEVHVYSPPELLAQPNPILLAHAVTDVVRAAPELRGTLLHSTIRRNPATHTLFNIGTTQAHLGVATPWSGLLCCGDWVRHPTPSLFLERAAVTGTDAASAVLQLAGRPGVSLLPHGGPEPLAAAIEWLARWSFRMMKRARGR